jgi:hypothetical protein
MDTVDTLRRAARRNSWKEEPLNTLDYFTVRFVRSEPDGRESRLMVRLNHDRIADAQVEVGGLRRQLTLPSLAHLEEVLAQTAPRPVSFPDLTMRDGDGLRPDAVLGAIRSYAEANGDRRLDNDAPWIVDHARRWGDGHRG